MWSELLEGKFVPVPLAEVFVKVSIVNLLAEIDVEQIYINEESHPIKVVYKLPLTKGMYQRILLSHVFVPFW